MSCSGAAATAGSCRAPRSTLPADRAGRAERGPAGAGTGAATAGRGRRRAGRRPGPGARPATSRRPRPGCPAPPTSRRRPRTREALDGHRPAARAAGRRRAGRRRRGAARRARPGRAAVAVRAASAASTGLRRDAPSEPTGPRGSSRRADALVTLAHRRAHAPSRAPSGRGTMPITGDPRSPGVSDPTVSRAPRPQVARPHRVADCCRRGTTRLATLPPRRHRRRRPGAAAAPPAVRSAPEGSPCLPSRSTPDVAVRAAGRASPGAAAPTRRGFRHDRRDRRPRPTRDPVFALHAGGKLEVVPRIPLRDRRDLSLAYTPGVAEVSRAIAADPRAARRLHRPRQHRRRGLRRHRRARPGRHRPRGGDAGHGGQGVAVQALRRHRRRPDLPGHDRRRRDRRHRRPAGPDLRRDQPRGHLRAALLRDRAPAAGAARAAGLPRRPARHGGRRARRPAQRRAGASAASWRRCGW